MGAARVVNLLRGSVALEVTGAFPERFLNLCAQRQVPFWGVEQPDETTLYLTVAWAHREGLEELGERTGCTIREVGRRGAPALLRRFRRRYALLTGFLLAALAVCLLSRVVLVVEVEGNERVPSQVILTELARLGVKPGAWGPSLATRDLCNIALTQLKDLSWMTVNLHGIRAQVVVRERVEKPELVDETVIGDIVAEAPGLITDMEVWSGDPAVKEGDTVLPGDVLIRGSIQMDPPEYSGLEPEWLPVRAMGKVEGRTWRTLSAAIPLETQVKGWTGDEKTLWSAVFFGQRVNFFGNSGIPYGKCDKISRTWTLTLPGGLRLPVSLTRETWRAYETATHPVDPQAAQAMLEEALLARLRGQLGETGEVLSHSFSAKQEGGLLTVTLTAECREALGRFVPTGEIAP